LNESNDHLALKLRDNSIRPLRRSGQRFRPVTSEVGWPTYNGSFDGNRYTALSKVDKANLAQFAPKWMFTVPGAGSPEATPVVMDGILYVTVPNECYALDAGDGRVLWQYQKPKTKDLLGRGALGIKRGAALAGNRLFMVTDNAHLLALNRFTGELIWETKMADSRLNYYATSAPLVVGDLVVPGTAGGEHGARGFLAAFEQRSGKEVWRFWTVPKPGEPGSETWKGSVIEHGGAVTWFTGSYDLQGDTPYWQTGIPGPDYNGTEREGDNLYPDCILALDPHTGKLKWPYQFTPHDLHDWDATEPAVLINTDWHGRPRKLLLLAHRNGFFYVFDRTNGELLLAKSFVHKLNWAKDIDSDGRPVLAQLEKVGEGTKVCPSQDGTTNWYSTAYLPSTGLYYMQTLEKCNIYSESPAEWKPGEEYLGGAQRKVPGELPQKILRAIDIQTGKVVWELPQTGLADTGGGTLATGSGLLFFCEDSGDFAAVDAANGKQLWRFHANQSWKASPTAYSFDVEQYSAVAAGPTVVAFALPE
jgi:alcohol dehydrogenase (cytochrome c)